MNQPTKEWDEFLVKASGIALLTVALTWLPSAMGAAMQIITYEWFQDKVYSGDSDMHKYLSKINTEMISFAVGKIMAFFVLLVLARWVFGYPQILRRAFQRTSQQPRETDAERDNPPIDR